MPVTPFAGVATALHWANDELNSKFVSVFISPKSGAAGKGSISSTTLTVTSVVGGSSAFEVGMIISGPEVATATWIVSRVGKDRKGERFIVSRSQHVAECQITGKFYVMNSIYFLLLQQLVLWWYWKDLLEFSTQALTWLNVDFEFLVGLRPFMIIFVAVLFDATFVFTNGLGHVVSIFSKVSACKCSSAFVHAQFHFFGLCILTRGAPAAA